MKYYVLAKRTEIRYAVVEVEAVNAAAARKKFWALYNGEESVPEWQDIDWCGTTLRRPYIYKVEHNEETPMIRYFCSECGEEVDDKGDVASCAQHPHAVTGSIDIEDKETRLDAPILPRDDDNHHMTYGGKRVVLLTSESANYREWDVTVGQTRYCIVCEVCDGETWTVMAYDPHTDLWVDAPGDVETFLRQHSLMLAS